MVNQARPQTTMQTRQTMLTRSLRDSFKAWCEQCCNVVLALTPESCSSLTAGTVSELLESGRLHVVEPGARSILICCSSLSVDPQEKQNLV